MGYVTLYLTLTTLMYALIFAQNSGFINKDSLTEYSFWLIRIYDLCLILIMFAILLPSSYTNKQT